jgi:hypothetical protein
MSKHTKRNISTCVACQPSRTAKRENSLLTQTATFPAPWLQELKRQAIPRHSARFQSLEASGFEPTTPCNANIVITYTEKDLPKKVVYWASGSARMSSSHLLKSAECAYGDYCNMGVAVRKGNTLRFVLQTPRPYLARQKGKTNSQLWCRHLHFVEVHENNQVDTSNKNVLYTLGVFPCSLLGKYDKIYSCVPLFHTDTSVCAQKHSMFVNFEQYLAGKTNGCVGVNAISDPEYPPISSDDIVLDWHTNVDSLHKQLVSHKNVKQNGMHTPFIVYCANETCAAAQELIHKMYEIGYCNVYYLKHGMHEARQKASTLRAFLNHDVSSKEP